MRLRIEDDGKGMDEQTNTNVTGTEQATPVNSDRMRPEEEPAADSVVDWTAEKRRKLDHLLESVQEKVESGEYKASIGDFVRLLQLRKEIEEERPREITVTWVEPSEGGNAPA